MGDGSPLLEVYFHLVAVSFAAIVPITTSLGSIDAVGGCAEDSCRSNKFTRRGKDDAEEQRGF